MYRKVKISERLPEIGKEVITTDFEGGNAIKYKLTDIGWNMVEPKDNLPMAYWLEEVPSFNSTELIGDVHKHFDLLKDKNWDWVSFYNGWLEGRFEMLFEFKDGKKILPDAFKFENPTEDMNNENLTKNV